MKHNANANKMSISLLNKLDAQLSKKEGIRIGLMSGRYQPFHKGHKLLLKRLEQNCDMVIMLVADDIPSKQKENPIPFKTRLELIDIHIQDKYADMDGYSNIFIGKAPTELKEGQTWANALFENFTNTLLDICCLQSDKKIINFTEVFNKLKTYTKPDIMVYGTDKTKWNWYNEGEIDNVDQLIIGRTSEDVSATKIRKALFEDNDLHSALEMMGDDYEPEIFTDTPDVALILEECQNNYWKLQENLKDKEIQQPEYPEEYKTIPVEDWNNYLVTLAGKNKMITTHCAIVTTNIMPFKDNDNVCDKAKELKTDLLTFVTRSDCKIGFVGGIIDDINKYPPSTNMMKESLEELGFSGTSYDYKLTAIHENDKHIGLFYVMSINSLSKNQSELQKIQEIYNGLSGCKHFLYETAGLNTVKLNNKILPELLSMNWDNCAKEQLMILLNQWLKNNKQ